jgi:hypothetical protein
LAILQEAHILKLFSVKPKVITPKLALCFFEISGHSTGKFKQGAKQGAKYWVPVVFVGTSGHEKPR